MLHNERSFDPVGSGLHETDAATGEGACTKLTPPMPGIVCGTTLMF
jgi:hypothetical protein